MALTGFDPNLVSTSINNVESAYNELMQTLYSETQSQFINPMGNYWACKDAQQFFTQKFKPALDQLLKGSFMVFNSVVQAMNSAAQEWAKQTQSQWVAKSFGGQIRSVDVSAIKENINGVRGADNKNATSTVAKLATIATKSNTALEHAANAVRNCGFVGGNQGVNLINSLSTIRNNINAACTELMNATTNAINTTTKSYGALTQNVETAFTGE